VSYGHCKQEARRRSRGRCQHTVQPCCLWPFEVRNSPPTSYMSAHTNVCLCERLILWHVMGESLPCQVVAIACAQPAYYIPEGMACQRRVRGAVRGRRLYLQLFSASRHMLLSGQALASIGGGAKPE